MQNKAYSFIIATYILNLSLGLESNKQQRYNSNTDFLVHEASGYPTAPKRDDVITSNFQVSGKRDYVAQFPSLGPTSGNTVQTTANPNFSTSTKTHTVQTSNKRDYVAPQFPSTKDPHVNTQQTGKVKDLVNFYDSKGMEQNVPQKTPSYSSVLRGQNNKNTGLSTATTSSIYITKHTQTSTQATPRTSHTYTTKPLSFSAVVAGSNKPSSTLTTPSPHSTFSKPVVPIRGINPSPTRPTSNFPVQPGHSVLPSAIVNNNKNMNQNSNSNVPTDSEIQTLSEELLRKDANNAAKYITVNYQEKTTSQSKEDKAPQPLLTIATEVWNITTIQKFVPLLDNYERDTLVNEYVTPQERNEENAFMDAIMSTTVIRHLMNFLKDKGYVTQDPRQQRDFLKQLWFSLYSRGKGKISSSGFEHIFVSELKNGEVSGLHNWIYFSKEELANRVNYLGYLKYSQFGDKGVVLKLHFNQQGVDKPVDSMFIGTSPELEIALYTLCFVTRADNECKLKLGTKDVDIVTHTFRYRSKNLIGSAYPQI